MGDAQAADPSCSPRHEYALLCHIPSRNSKPGLFYPTTSVHFPRQQLHWRMGGGVTEGIAHTLSSCCFLLDFSLPCSLFHSNKWISPLVPCKASPPILRPLEISSFAISTHQGGAANRTSSLSGKRVHLLEPTDPLRDSDSRPSLHLPSTSSHVPTTSPLLLSLSCLACTARPSLFHPRGLCQLCM